MTSPDPKPLEVFKAEDFYRAVGTEVGSAYHARLCAADANWKLAPLIEALERLEEANRGSTLATAVAAGDVLTAFRRLVGQENSGEVNEP